MKASVHSLNGRPIQDEAVRLAALLDQARDHAAAFRNREGLQSAREALNIARRRQDSIAAGRALGAATLCHYQRADYVAAIATGLDAVAAYADGDSNGRSRALQSIALALFSVEAYDQALAMADQSVLDAAGSGDREREALARGVFAAILAERGDFEGARRQFRHCAGYYRNTADVVRMKKVTSNLAHTYRKQGLAEEAAGHPAQARLYWTQALRIYRLAYAAVRHDPDDAIVLGAIAECEFRVGRLEAAYVDAKHGLELARKIGCNTILANGYLWEGRILEALGDLDGAERAFERACEHARHLEQDRILGDSLDALATVLARRDHSGRAGEVRLRAQTVREDRDAFLERVRNELGPLWNRLIDFHA